MSQYQPPPFQPDYYNGPIASPRPTSVTAISIVAIIFGSLGVLCGGMGLVMQILVLASGGKNPFMPTAPMMTSHALLVFQAISGVVSLVLAAGLLAAGIGGLKLLPWARTTMLWVAIAIIVWATIGLVLGLVWVGPETAKVMQQFQAQQNAGAPGLPASMYGGIQKVTMIVTWILELIFPIFILIYWRSPRVVAAFEPGTAPPGSPGPIPPYLNP